MNKKYIAIGDSSYLDKIEANPYLLHHEYDYIYLEQVDKSFVKNDDVIYYLIDELSSSELSFLESNITLIRLDDIIKLDSKTNGK